MKIVNLTSFPIYPPASGGQLRVYNLNLMLSRKHEISIFSLGIRNSSEVRTLKSIYITKIDDNYVEYRYVDPLSRALAKGIIPGTLRTLMISRTLNKNLQKKLKKTLLESDLVQVELPWLFEYVYKIKPLDVPIILDEHDVAYELYEGRFKKHQMLFPILNVPLKKLKEKEKFALENSDVVFVPSRRDKYKLSREFGVSPAKIHVVPNGVNTGVLKPPKAYERNRLKEEFGVGNKTVILFTGSVHWPNLEAIPKIIDLAKKVQNKELLFLIVGSAGEKFKYHANMENVIITGKVSDITPYFKLADIAINPVTSGSGTNLKMLEYMSAGLPVITTKFGARGLDIKNGKHAITCNLKEFPKWIEFLSENEQLREKLGKNGRKLIEKKYDWKIIAEKVDKIYRKLIK